MSRPLRRRGAHVAHPTPIHPTPTVIEFLLDESGSMTNHLNATIGGYNDFLEEQVRAGGQCLLTLTKFEGGNYRTPYEDIDVRMVPHLTPKTFRPGGGTPLRDAILHRLRAIPVRLARWDIRPQVIFVVMTDGDDTGSLASVADVSRELAGAREAGWTPVYLGANQNAALVAGSLGFPAGNIRSFETARMRETLRDLATATTAYRAAAGAAPSTDFFGAGR